MYLVRAGEIFLKGKNHRIFENKLINNIKKATDCKTFKNFKNLYLIDSNKNLDKVFGITSYSEVIETELDKINETALTFVKDQKSFRIRAKRTTKDYKPSPQIEREVGAHVVEKRI